MTIKELPYPQTPETAYSYFRGHGISIRSWSKDHGLPYSAVKDLLLQRTKGNRGQAHNAAVALGFKPNPQKLRKVA